MATPNKVEIDVTADTAQAVSGLSAVKREMAAAGSGASTLEGFAKGAGSGLDQLGQSGAAANAGLGKTRAGITSISEQLNLARTQIAAFISAQLGLGAVREVAQTADAYQNLQARVQLATGQGQAFTAAFEEVTEIAKRTSSNLEQTGTLFARLTEAGKSSGLATQDAIAQSLRLTETINQAVQLSGGSAQSSAAAVTQLIQGLQSGVLRGEEFNSVMEQAPRLSKALADGLGVTTGELRKMAETGQLSAQTVIAALKGQSDTLKQEFATLPATVGRAVENLSTSWTLYVGEVDKASGASTAAAGAIDLLAKNLSTVGGLLLDAGQAAAGFAAFKLAQTFLGIGAASTQAATAVAGNTTAVVTNTAAHQANAAAAARESLAFKSLAADVAAQATALSGNTAATAANTAAKNAAGAAANTAAAGVGRFAAVLSTIKTFSLIGLLTNIQDIGTALGEGAARLLGYKDGTNALAQAEKDYANAVSATAAVRERGLAAAQAEIDKQFALSKAAKASIAEFDKLRASGDTAAEAVAKIGKDFDLSKQPGIRDAAAVLDKLAADGKLSATEFEGAWSKALKNVDLSVFEVQARAALAGTARETERLAQIMDGTLREAVRRTGLDFDVIKGGMSKAAASAINDTEVIIAGLDRLKAQGVDTGQALAASIGKGIQTADSQKAIELVQQQIEGLRKTLGDKVTDGLLDQAAQKARELGAALDAAKPGVNSLAEAMKQLGITSDASLKETAKQSQLAYDAMRETGTASARELGAGFAKAAQDAIAANNGIAPGWVQAQAAARGYSVEIDAAGKATLRSMADAKGAVNALGTAVQGVTVDLEKQSKVLDEINAKYGQSKAESDARYSRPNGKSVTGNTREERLAGQVASDNTGLSSLQAKRRAGTLSADDLKTAQAVYDTALVNKDVYDKNATAFSSEGARSIFETVNAARSLLDEVKGLGRSAQIGNSSAKAGSAYVVKIDLGQGRTRDVNVASANDAQALISALRDARLAA
jgi:tape measure domain-containing protein